MKTNLLTRMIIDTENNKVYLSIEGETKNATNEEKIKLRDTLINAFSYVLGLSSSVGPQGTEISDFEPSDENQDKVPGFLYNSRKKTEESSKNHPEPIEPTMGIGKYRDLTAAQIIEKYGEEGANYLKERLLPIFQRNIKLYPQNQKKINSIIEALKYFQDAHIKKSSSPSEKRPGSISFDEMVEEIERVSAQQGDEDLKAVRDLCEAFGTSYRDIIDRRDEEKLSFIYGQFMRLDKEKGGAV